MTRPPLPAPGLSGEPATLPRLRVDRSGAWLDGDVEITHPGILGNLRSSLRRDAEGYFIQTRVRIPVEVEDVPFVVERVEVRDDALRVILNDGTVETVEPSTLRVGAGAVPYCAVKGGTFEARLSRAAAYQLLSLATPREGGQAVLRLGGREHVIPWTA